MKGYNKLDPKENVGQCQSSMKDFLKDHRVFMTATVAALIFGGDWSIANKDAINTSFPSFLKKIKYLGAKIR